MFGKQIPVSVIFVGVVLVFGLAACTVPTTTGPAVTERPTIVVTTVVTPTPEPTAVVVTATPEPTAVVVTVMVVATNTPTPPTETPTMQPTETSPPRPRAMPTSAGPLDFTHWLAGWSLVSSAEDEWEYVIHVEVTGGSPPYVYHHDLETFDTPDITWPARSCTALVHTIQVDSADGQSVRRDYWYPAPWCATPEP